MQNSPPINLRKRFVPIYHERLPSILYWARHYALALLLNLAGVYSSIFARKCRIKLAKILNLAKMIVKQNRSVSLCIIYKLECSQLKPLRVRVLH